MDKWIAGKSKAVDDKSKMKPIPIPRKFYERNPIAVARDLLGQLLVRRAGRMLVAGRIVETEAYLGKDDAAAHAYSCKTPRNAVLFGPAGHAYVYFTYGVHHCMNISCEPDGEAGCVLLRALEPVNGIAEMAKARGMEIIPRTQHQRKMLASGPGRLCMTLGITRERDNGKDLTSSASDLMVVDDGFCVERVLATPRVGISKAIDKKLRFVVAGNEYVTARK